MNKIIRSSILIICFVLVGLASASAQDELETYRRDMEENLAFLSYDMGIYRDALRKVRQKNLSNSTELNRLEEQYDKLRQDLNYLDREFQSFRVATIISSSSTRDYDVQKRSTLDLRYRRVDREFYAYGVKLNSLLPIKLRQRDVMQDSDIAGTTMVNEKTSRLYAGEKTPETASNPPSEVSERLQKSGVFSAKDLSMSDQPEWELKGNMYMEASHQEVDGSKPRFEQDNFGSYANDNGKFQLNMEFKEEPQDEATGITFGSLHIDATQQDTLREAVNLKFGGKDFTLQLGTKLLPALSEFTLNNLELAAFMGDMRLRQRWTLGFFAGNVSQDVAPGIKKINRRIFGGTLGYKMNERTHGTAIFSEVRRVMVAALKLRHNIPNQGNFGIELSNSEDRNNNHLKGSAYRLLFKLNRQKLIFDGEYLNLDENFRTQGNPEYASRLSDLKQYTLNGNYQFSKHLRAIAQYSLAEEGNQRASVRIPTDTDGKSLLLLFTKPGAPRVTLLLKNDKKEGSTATLGSVDQTTKFNLLKVKKKLHKTETEVSYLTVDFDSTGTSGTPVNFKLKNPALKLTTYWDKKLKTYLNYSYQNTTGSTENEVKFLEARAEWKLTDFRKIFSKYSERRLKSPITTNRSKKEYIFGYQYIPKKDYVVTYKVNYITNKEKGSDYDATGGTISLRRKF